MSKPRIFHDRKAVTMTRKQTRRIARRAKEAGRIAWMRVVTLPESGEG